MKLSDTDFPREVRERMEQVLLPGDEVRFIDLDGNIWNYVVSGTEVIAGYDVERMKSGDWDLTLFTCTYGGENRYTLRCTMVI